MFLHQIFCLAVIVTAVTSKVHFKDNLKDEDWESRWKQSKHKDDYGKFVLSSGKYDTEGLSKGLKTSQDARFYALSAGFDKFSNENQPLVVQFSVKHDQNIDCGGGYVKLFPSTMDQNDMHDQSEYNIMFGPDICGTTKKVHVILHYKGKNLDFKKDIRCKDDVFTHVYTLILKPDNTFEVLIDNEKVESGDLESNWDFLLPKEIKDPEAKKPSDWDDREKLDDPEDTKPEDWDQPEHIPDADATKPEDWDDDMDGDWEPPMVDNPDYKGEWKPRQIDNPDYKGSWKHPMIANPDYVADDALYKYEDFGSIGLDLWQVKSGSIFSDFLITDDVDAAKTEATEVLKLVTAEKKAKEVEDEAEKKRMQEESEKAGGDNDSDEDEDEEEEVVKSPEHEEL